MSERLNAEDIIPLTFQQIKFNNIKYTQQCLINVGILSQYVVRVQVRINKT